MDATAFQQLYRDGCRVQGRRLRLYWRPLSVGDSRMGVVVTRRAGVRLATQRNRLKRWLREAIRHEQCRLAQPCEMICAVTALRDPMTYQAIRDELQQLWRRAGLIKI